MDQKAVIAELAESLLNAPVAPSDRFAYSRYFVPRELVGVPPYRQRVIDAIIQSVEDLINQMRDLGDVLSGNPFASTAANRKEQKEQKAPTGAGLSHKAFPGARHMDSKKALRMLRAPELEQLGTVLKNLRARKNIAGELANLARLATNDNVRKAAGVVAAATVATGPAAGAAEPAVDFDDLDITAVFFPVLKLLDTLRSEIGYSFNDRTRITPAGLAIGEHIYSLSLAPGEEITIEQKSWTKRSATRDETSEEERTGEVELSSSVTTELQDSLDHTTRMELQLSGSSTVGANIAIPEVPVSPNAGLEIKGSITVADEAVRKTSLKETKTKTSKLTAKHRALHKITFQVSSESGSESSTRRIIRNPNRATPINLRYYKILQSQVVTHERYGARLCWAPWISDPGLHVRERQQAIRAKVQAGSPAPVAPATRSGKWSDWGPIRDLGQRNMWSPVLTEENAAKMDIAGGMSREAVRDFGSDFRAECAVPDGWKWDGRQIELKLNFEGSRSHEVHAVGTPTLEFGKVRSDFHVGIDCTRSTVAGAQLNAQDAGRCPIDEPEYRENVSVQMRVFLLPAMTTEEQAAYEQYARDMERWRDDEAQRIQRESASAMDAETQARLAALPLDVASELHRRLVECLIPIEARDEYQEIDLWHRLFEWEAASYTLYPGWWSSTGIPDPGLPATDFANASWARVFLPVRIGMEELALRWLFSGFSGDALSTEWNAQVATLVKELRDYRKASFGAEDELVVEGTDHQVIDKFKVLGSWREMLPTDGTHLEIVQSATTAADQLTLGEMGDENRLRDVNIAERREEVRLKRKVRGQMTGSPNVDVSISTEGDE